MKTLVRYVGRSVNNPWISVSDDNKHENSVRGPLRYRLASYFVIDLQSGLDIRTLIWASAALAKECRRIAYVSGLDST